MRTSTVALLECPFCGGALSVARRDPEAGEEIESGILRCACGEIPVVGGIPIFRREGRVDVMLQTRDAPSSVGPPVHAVLELVRSGRGEEALLLLLVPPDRSIRKALLAVELMPARWQGRARRALQSAWARRARARSGAFLEHPPKATAREVLSDHYRRLGRPEHFHHFFHRFSQPRHLTSLALAELLAEGRGAGLDLACGPGHTLHALATRAPRRAWIGLDRNFFELYFARRWTAPGADYVCADADGPLPFARGVFGGALCSDAFHYFLRKRLSAAELLRVVDLEGVILLSRIGNRLVEPREGYELDPGGYRALFPGAASRLASDRGILDRYLSGRAPDLSGERPGEELAKEKWLSLVVDRGGRALRDHGAFSAWPHGFGRLRVNPLYAKDAPDRGRWSLRMPSKWFEVENGACRAYMPETVELPDEVVAGLEAGRRTKETEELVRRCVVLGFPERYF